MQQLSSLEAQLIASFGERFAQAVAACDARNRLDPNQTIVDGQPVPKELAYARRMTEMLQRYRPESGELLHLAARGQHIERWTLPRDAYPMTRPGYHQWRTRLKTYHGEVMSEIMQAAGYDAAAANEVALLVSKKAPATDAQMQVLEDVIVMVFVEYYLEDFVAQHPEYDIPKWKDIMKKTLRKVSAAGVEGLVQKVNLPQALLPLIQEVMQEGWA